MKKDIEFPDVTGVDLVVAKESEAGEEAKWAVYLINRNLIELETVMITSKGYGEIDGEKRETSILRHMIEKLEAQSYARVEPIDPAVFQLNNEFWVSYYILDQLFDKKFVFVEGALEEGNLQKIDELGLKGIRHA